MLLGDSTVLDFVRIPHCQLYIFKRTVSKIRVAQDWQFSTCMPGIVQCSDTDDLPFLREHAIFDACRIHNYGGRENDFMTYWSMIQDETTFINYNSFNPSLVVQCLVLIQLS